LPAPMAALKVSVIISTQGAITYHMHPGDQLSLMDKLDMVGRVEELKVSAIGGND
jgi:hypothetical protein